MMCPSWLFTSDCSIDELNFQLVQLNITTYNAPSSFFFAWRFPTGFHSVSTLFHSRDGSDKA